VLGDVAQLGCGVRGVGLGGGEGIVDGGRDSVEARVRGVECGVMALVAPSTASFTWRTPWAASPRESDSDVEELPVAESRLVEPVYGWTCRNETRGGSEYAPMCDAARAGRTSST